MVKTILLLLNFLCLLSKLVANCLVTLLLAALPPKQRKG